MPTYEYACRACGHEFEREQRISEDPIRKCPSCGKDEARRLISRTSFVLKGGGWYSDLYSSKPAAKSEGEGAAKSGGEKGDKAETAAKPEKAEKAAKAEKSEKTGGSPKGSKSAA
jgi:putative FmdB family regulatory protein